MPLNNEQLTFFSNEVLDALGWDEDMKDELEIDPHDWAIQEIKRMAAFYRDVNKAIRDLNRAVIKNALS